MKVYFCSSELYQCNISQVLITERGQIVEGINRGRHEAFQTDEDVRVILFFDSTVFYFPQGLSNTFSNLTHLVLVDCGLKEITKNDLAGFQNVESLTLDNNQLRSLPADLFTDLPKLERVSFNNNQLQNLSAEVLKNMSVKLRTANFNKNPCIDASYCAHKSVMVNNLEDLSDFVKIHRLEKKQKEQLTSRVTKYFRSLWGCVNFSDGVISCDSEIKGFEMTFNVHRIVLSTNCPTFESNFMYLKANCMKPIIRLNGYRKNDVETMLWYLYTMEIKIDEKNSAMDIFRLAKSLDLPDLMAAAEKVITRTIDSTNAFSTVVFGNKFKSEEIKRVAFQEVRRSVPSVPFDENLMNNPEDLKKIIDVQRRKSGAEEVPARKRKGSISQKPSLKRVKSIIRL